LVLLEFCKKWSCNSDKPESFVEPGDRADKIIAGISQELQRSGRQTLTNTTCTEGISLGNPINSAMFGRFELQKQKKI
jgi:hypothetical protein